MSFRRSLPDERNPTWLLPTVVVFIILTLVPRMQRDTPGSVPAVLIVPLQVSFVPDDAAVIPADEALDRFDLSAHMAYFFDKAKEYPDPLPRAGRDPQSPFYRSFRPAEGKTHWGVHTEVCWFRVAVTSTAPHERHYVASNLVDHVPFSLEPGASVLLYYRLEYDDAGIVCTPSVTDAGLHAMRMRRRTIYASVMLGVYLGLFLYNLFLAVSTRDRAYPAYLAGLGFFTLYLLFREFDLPLGGWNIASAAFAVPGYVCILLFTRNYFRISRTEHPRLFLGFAVLFGFGMVALASAAVSASVGTVLKYGLSVFLIVYAVWITIARFSADRRRSVLYIVAWAPPLVCLLFSLLAQLQIVQFRDGSIGAFLGSNPSMYLQIGLQMILLALALGDRINRERSAAAAARLESAELRTHDEARKTFIMHVSHEVRTVLMVIGGVVAGLTGGRFGGLPPSAAHATSSLAQSVRQLEEHVANLLAFTRINERGSHLELRPADVGRRLALLCAGYTSLAEAKGIRFPVHVDPSQPMVVRQSGDLFELMVNNLLANAFKHTPPGGEIQVAATTEEDDRHCRISVRNTGSSIPSDSRERVFRKFERNAEDNDGTPGMGLGLYMVRQCARIMGGDASVSGDDGGVQFSVRLPLTTDAPAAEAQSTPSQPFSTGSEDRPHVLLVEDNHDLREFLRRELAEEFQVTTAADGAEALSRLEAEPMPDAVITDILMPRVDGAALFETARERYGPGIPFVFLSAIDAAEQKRSLFDQGAVDFVTKPFDPQMLKAKIRNLLAWNAEELDQQRAELKSAVLAVFDQAGTPSSADPDEIPANAPRQAPERQVAALAAQFDLSRRESQIVLHLVRGLRDKEIAAELGLAVSTVSNYLQRIYRKTGTQSRVALLRLVLGSESPSSANESPAGNGG
jgi:signal transduction histidine kinase/DNA-binding NarL/FixJ family response regulator